MTSSTQKEENVLVAMSLGMNLYHVREDRINAIAT